jgi:hypothetical protein
VRLGADVLERRGQVVIYHLRRPHGESGRNILGADRRRPLV